MSSAPSAADPAPVGSIPPVSRLLFGTTSYVVPADLLPNVRLLAPFVDDIEVVLFEGDSSNLPTRAVVAEMGRIASDAGCGFSIHLPLDVGIGELDPAARRRGQDVCLRVIDLTLGLEPHAYVVHPELPLVYHPALGEPPEPLDCLPAEIHAGWQAALSESLGRLRVETGPYPLAVENLQFTYAWVKLLLEQHDLGVTMDVGHLLLHGGEVAGHVREFGERLTVVHMHGIVEGRDHREIGSFARPELVEMLKTIAAAPTSKPVWSKPSGGQPDGPGARRPEVVVSLEVFGWKPTVPSLRVLADVLEGARVSEAVGVLDGRGAARRLRSGADAIMRALPTWDPAVEET